MTEEKNDIESISPECKKAIGKAMSLLLLKDRTEKELRDKMARAKFSDEAIEYALDYVGGYGYINDYRYATTYISYHQETRSKKEIISKLKNKGVSSEVLEEAFYEYDEEMEDKAAFNQMNKRMKGRVKESLDEKEKQKEFAFLARKGFSFAVINRVWNAYE